MAMGKWEGLHLPEIILSLLVLLGIFWLIDIGKIAAIISKTSIPLFLAALAVYFSTTLLMSYRIRFVLAALGEKISFFDSLKANMGGLIASDFSPGRSGYFATPLVLGRLAKIPLDKGMVAIVAPQLVEFFLKAAGAAAAIFLVASTLPLLSQNSLFLWLGVGVMLAFCAAMALALFFPPFIPFAHRFSIIPFVSQACGFISSMQSHRQQVSSVALPIIAVSVAVFLIKGLECFLFASALGISLSSLPVPPLLVFVFLQPLITIFQFVPIPTFAGLGLSEGSAALSMSLLGVSPEMAVAYVLLMRGGTILANSPGVPVLSKTIFGRE